MICRLDRKVQDPIVVQIVSGQLVSSLYTSNEAICDTVEFRAVVPS